MHLRVQIPARNEAPTLFKVARAALLAADGLMAEGRVERVSALIIDDGSSDGTREIADALARRDARVEVLSTGRSRGLGYAFRLGLEHARASAVDVLVHLDADGQFDAADLPTLARPVLLGERDLVTASRFLEVEPDPPLPLSRRLGNRALAALVSTLAGVDLRDVSCGFRAFSRRAIFAMHLEGDFTYTHESLLACAFAGLSIAEVPVRVKGVRPHGTSRVAKSLVGYGVRATSILARACWRHRLVPGLSRALPRRART